MPSLHSKKARFPAENTAFYNQYHAEENQGHHNWQGKIKPISDNNFTYFFHFQALAPFLTQLPKISVLDVGCGVGTLSLYLAQKGAKKVVGSDLSPQAIAHATTAQQTLQLKNLSFTTTPIAKLPGHFDLIIASEIIEHVSQPATFLADLYQKLSPNGYLILTTPYAHNWLRHQGFLNAHDRRAGHLAIYDDSDLTKLLLTQNWQLISFKHTEGPLRMLLFITPLHHLIRFIRGPLVPLFHAIDEMAARLLGKHDIQVVMRKINN